MDSMYYVTKFIMFQSLCYGGREIKKLLCNSFESYDSVLRQFNADIAENPIRGKLKAVLLVNVADTVRVYVFSIRLYFSC